MRVEVENHIEFEELYARVCAREEAMTVRPAAARRDILEFTLPRRTVVA